VLVDAHLPHDLTPLYIAHALHHSTKIKDLPATLNLPSPTCTLPSTLSQQGTLHVYA
jgi:hypothetical protein